MLTKKLCTQNVVVMYTENHWTMEEIGRFYGVTRQAVYKHLKKAGIKAHQGEQVQVNCVVCGQEFQMYRKRYKLTKRPHCSNECYLVTRMNPDYIPWRQGSRIARLLVSQYFPLKPEHVVHHQDSNQRNYKIENLMVFANHSDHMKWHHGVDKTVKPLWNGAEL